MGTRVNDRAEKAERGGNEMHKDDGVTGLIKIFAEKGRPARDSAQQYIYSEI